MAEEYEEEEEEYYFEPEEDEEEEDEEDDEEDDERATNETELKGLAAGALGLFGAFVLANNAFGYSGGSSTENTTNLGPPFPLPAPPPPTPHAVHLDGPLKPWPRDVTPRGYYGAPRYAWKVPFTKWSKSSAHPFYPGQAVDHTHGGADYAGAEGESVYAVEDGDLSRTDPGPFGAPGAVALVGADGRRWTFVHIDPVGELPRHVKAGDAIAKIGRGQNHVHVGLTVGGDARNPVGYF